jgi:hypothetical protein
MPIINVAGGPAERDPECFHCALTDLAEKWFAERGMTPHEAMARSIDFLAEMAASFPGSDEQRMALMNQTHRRLAAHFAESLLVNAHARDQERDR